MLAAVLFGLVILRAEASPPIDLNDSGLHLSMTRWAGERLRHGHNPFDGWYPYLGVGFPQTHHYQSVPHVITATAGLAIGVSRAYHWSLYLLLALWPIAVFAGARLLGLGRLPSACAAVIAPLVVSVTNYGYEMTSYTWQGLGIWPQLWAAWLLPITIGLAHRALRKQLHPAWPALALAATIGCHFITAYLALAVIGLMPLVDWARLRERASRMVLLTCSAGALSLWVLLPLLLDRAGANYTGYQRGTFWYDSFGARKVLGWLVSGELLDHGRFPIVTLLAAVGLVVTIQRSRSHIGSRVVLLLGGLSLLLFFGRPTLGPVLRLLPLGSELFYPRFIIGVHLAAVLAAGTGLAALARAAERALRTLGPERLVASAVAFGALLVLWPALRDRIDYNANGRSLIATQRAAQRTDGLDVDELLRQVRGSDGRVYAGTNFNWGQTYGVGYVPMHAVLLARDIDAVGWLLRVSSVGTIAESVFDETNPADYAALGIHWLLLPADRPPSVPAALVATAGRSALYEIASPGYGEVVDAIGVIDANTETLATEGRLERTAELRAVRRSLIRWAGHAGEPSSDGTVTGSPGDVRLTVARPDEGDFTFDIDADRAAYVAVAASWHPRLVATVDGRSADVVMIAPGTAAVATPAGHHVVRVRYRPFRYMLPIVLAGIALFVMTSMTASGRLRFPRSQWPRPPSTRSSTPSAEKNRRATGDA